MAVIIPFLVKNHIFIDDAPASNVKYQQHTMYVQLDETLYH